MGNNRRIMGILLGMALALVLTAGCAGSEEGPTSQDGPRGPAGPQDPGATPTPAAAPTPTPGGAGLDVDERMVVRNADMSIVVEDVEDAVGRVTAAVDELDGTVLESRRQGQGEDFQSAFMSFRVPSERLDEALSRVREIAGSVESERVTSQDVTEEFVDVQARLENLRATEQRLTQLYERADSVGQVLEVERELTRVRGDIESLEGRLQVLQRTTATSRVNLEIRPEPEEEPLSDPGWTPEETWRRAVRGLSDFGQGLADFLIFAAVFSPVWGTVLVVAGAAAWWGRKHRRARR
ncbi:MAG: DUF4349 domain-containing protein [Chloroflexota bacterium]